MKNLSKSIVGAGLLYCAFAIPIGLSEINAYRNRRMIDNSTCIKSEEKLREVFDEEKTKIGLKDIPIELIIEEIYGTIGRSSWDDEGNENKDYKIIIHPNYMCRELVRHELFHINRIQSGSFSKFFPLNHLEEWRATSYALNDE